MPPIIGHRSLSGPGAPEGSGPVRRHSEVVDQADIQAGYRWVRRWQWPRSFPLVQFPNNPLILASLAGLFAAVVHGAAHSDARAVSYLAMTVWAYEEFAHGDNWFRHLLGFAYLVSTAVALASALRH
jgi:hypothetical protein